MAIEKVKRANGKQKYKVVIYEGMTSKGKRLKTSRTVDTIREAKELEKELKRRVKEKRSKKPAQCMTMHEFYSFWKKHYADQQLKIGTSKMYESMWPRIDKTFGKKYIHEINATSLMEFYSSLKTCKRLDGREGTLSSRTIRKYHAFLHLLFSKAKQWRLIKENTCDYVDPPKWRYDSDRKMPSKEELNTFFVQLKLEPLKYQVWCYIGFGLGCRRGEIYGLQWRDIDFETKTIYIQRQSQAKKGGGVYLTDPKTIKSKRRIFVPDNVLAILKKYKEEQLDYCHKLANKWKGSEDFDKSFLFIQWDGQPASPGSINIWLKKFVKKNNLPQITPHMLRHMAASYLLAQGTDIVTVAHMLGHSSPTTTETIYAHVITQNEIEAANQMNTLLNSLDKSDRKDDEK